MANTRRVTLLDAASNAGAVVNGAATRVSGARVTIQIPVAATAVVTIQGSPDGVNWPADGATSLSSAVHLSNDLTDNLLAARGEGTHNVNERVEWIRAQLAAAAVTRHIVVASVHEEND